MTPDQFVQKYNHQPIEVEDPSNRDMCMDEAFAYCDALGIPRETIRHLNAFEAFTLASDVTRQYFDVIPYKRGVGMLIGDLAVWKPNGKYTGKAGHIDTIYRTGANGSFYGFDQNWAGHAYCEILWHDDADIIGLLRPKKLNQGGEDVASPTLVNLHAGLAFNRQADSQEIQVGGKMTPEESAQNFYNNSELNRQDMARGQMAREGNWQNRLETAEAIVKEEGTDAQTKLDKIKEIIQS